MADAITAKSNVFGTQGTWCPTDETDGSGQPITQERGQDSQACSETPSNAGRYPQPEANVARQVRCYSGSSGSTCVHIEPGYIGDRPNDPGTPRRPDAAPLASSDHRESDYQKAKDDIGVARTHIPNIQKYADGLANIRARNEGKFRAALKELQQKNPVAWIKLQEYPLFRAPNESSQFNNTVKVVTKTVAKPGDIVSNSVEYGLNRAATNAQETGLIPKPNPSTVSKVMTTNAAATAVSRAGGVFLQVGLEALNPEDAPTRARGMLLWRLRQLEGREGSDWMGTPLMNDTDEYLMIHQNIVSGDPKVAIKMMDDWVEKHKPR